MTKISKLCITLITFLFMIFAINTKVFGLNNDIYVYPGGESIGLKIDTGVEIVGKYSVKTNDGFIKPWSDSDIKVSDKIIAINNTIISNNDELLSYIKSTTKNDATLLIKRGQKEFTTKIKIVDSVQNERTIGLYVKDKLLGVGTLSFVTTSYDFASLGHGVYDEEELLDDKLGLLTYSSVLGVKKASNTLAGEKRAILKNKEIGKVSKIKNTGVYGSFLDKIDKSLVRVASINEVSPGKAKIYSVINGDDIEAFDINILECKKQSSIDVKGIKIQVTDDKLLKNTGGIVQGMSGSPIIQDDLLVGVVSHVTLDDSSIGYGIYALWMYEELMTK